MKAELAGMNSYSDIEFISMDGGLGENKERGSKGKDTNVKWFHGFDIFPGRSRCFVVWIVQFVSIEISDEEG